MRYNQLSYHKANPFYKQDFLPDRAWYNRKPKDFPSEIPTGQEYFVDSGRKHFNGRFNHSQIASTSILESPQRYPFENRIAQDKAYMRNLDTIDIEGAASGTRMNQSIKNKLKAQEELARRYNQSLDMREHKDKTYDEKRREIANKQFETLAEKKTRQIQEQSRTIIPENSQGYGNLPEEINQQTYQQHYGNNNYSSKYINLLPKPYYSHLQQQQLAKSDRRTNQSSDQPPYEYPPQPQLQQNHDPEAEMRRYEATLQKQRKEDCYNQIPTNNRHKSNPQCYNAFDAELQRRREEYTKNAEMDEMSKYKLQDKKEFRKYNPTNLSFNLAAQSIVGNHR